MPYPKNPSRDHKSNAPRDRGKTRTQGATLEYRDPVDDEWKPAVRLEDIRARLIREAPPSLYDHEKEKGYDATDVTTFLEKDKTYGGLRQHRAPLLYQIRPTGPQGLKPSGYMKDGDRVVLDAFDHGIRDFPGILPKLLSSELAGHDIMHYFRQNEHIQLYDLIARQPNGYHEQDGKGNVTWHNGPPRYGTVGMRATRFRLQAGLLSWKKRMGSDIRNAGILSFIPNECKYPQVNSTESFRDLTQAEQDSIEKTLKGTAPGRKRNDHPDKNGKKEPVEDNEDAEGDSVGGDFEVTAYAKTPTRVLVKTQQSVNSASSQQSKMKHKSQHNNDSDFSGNESDKPIVKRQRIHGPMKGANTPQHAAINDTSVRRSSRRVTLPRQQVESRPDNTNMSNEPEDDLGAEEESGESSESKPAKYITQEAQDIITGPDPLTARIVNAAAMNGQYTRTTRKSTASAKTNPIPAGKDIRIVVPTIDPENIEENMASLQAALDLTRLDYFKKTGWRPPPSLVKEHKDLSYTLQWHALQKMFAQAYRGEERPVPHLYLLPRWEGTFQDWEPHDEEGQQLLLEST